MITLLLADSNELIRIGLRSVFSESSFQITGEARCTSELLSQVRSFEPDVVLIDYTSEGFTVDAIVEARSLCPSVRFVGITPLQSGQTLIHAIKSGITSYVKKDCHLEEIKDAVVETAHNNSFFCSTILQTIRDESIDVSQIEAIDCDAIHLSEREREIITLIAEGMTNAQISEKLFLSKHTVNTHRKNIMHKLGVRNTAGIVMYAVKEHYTSPNKYLFSSER